MDGSGQSNDPEIQLSDVKFLAKKTRFYIPIFGLWITATGPDDHDLCPSLPLKLRDAGSGLFGSDAECIEDDRACGRVAEEIRGAVGFGDGPGLAKNVAGL